jgi:hypothetical protein
MAGIVSTDGMHRDNPPEFFIIFPDNMNNVLRQGTLAFPWKEIHHFLALLFVPTFKKIVDIHMQNLLNF